jgi:hypothetical protein
MPDLIGARLMHTLMSTVACPTCGQPATITIFEQIDPATGADTHEFEFTCTDHCVVADVELIQLWAAAQA